MEKPLRLIPEFEKLTTVTNPRGYIGCSVIGHECDRYIWLNKYGKQLKYEIPFRLGRIFERGNLEEERIFSSIKKLSCVELLSTQLSFASSILQGSCDGVIKDKQGNQYILELKTMNDGNFKRLKKHGLSKSNATYWSQCQAYMHLAIELLLLDFKGVLFLAVNKNDESMYEELIEYDPLVGEGLVAKAKRIDGLEEMPDGIFSVEKKPQACFTCSFHKHCYGEPNV